ncbi:hypothetical protein FA15DRAFT_585662 [Coprinopsis marcescibilis]|uniref:AA9 family lytic polysaccharide monooxygenase n=1 Tax=Coprinopsis marcescibilis TaxID=230819 RepID=A0A5C3L496_COPMA|nr:hypothetical protein FA15DRAFT_585662 [Coprinopsis marcescibilis]
MRLILSFVGLATMVASAMAHTTVFGVFVNGVEQGDGRNAYIRSPTSNGPVKDLKSAALACNDNNRVVPRTVEVQTGDLLTFEWFHDNRDDDIIDRSHKGPVLVYMANSDGKDWTKIFEDNFSETWAVDRLVDAHGQHSVIIPNVPAGDYLLRAEIIAHHESDTLFTQNPSRGAQLYPSCVQVRVVSNGNSLLPGGAAFPGAYTDADPGIHFNLYSGPAPASYKAPGPAVWSGALGGSIGRVAIPGQGAIATPPAIVTQAPAPATSAAVSQAPTVTQAPDVQPSPTSVPNNGLAGVYAQCGGVSVVL